MTINHSELNIVDRFFKYVKIDTQSDPDSTSFPSTEKQKNLGKVLKAELEGLGLEEIEMDEYGYVFATIPSNTDKEVPTICFCSHMDTSPDSSGKDVKPIIHKNYDGSDIVLPDDNNQVIRMEDYKKLSMQIGNDVITASGTTLLGADNKSGLAEIMAAAEYLMNHPEIKHGKIRILFTPDEEIGRGVDKLDMAKLNADFGYTVDGEERGSMEAETFSADSMEIRIKGVSIHPGFAKGKLESAIKIASEIIDKLPKDGLSPETTEGMEGFVHPVRMEGHVEEAKIVFIIRDFDTSKLEAHENKVKEIANGVIKGYNKSSVEFIIKEQYRNMKEVLDQHPQVVENARIALERTGLTPKIGSIRGGTDGSRLSFMGLPCPNIFAGEHAFHSKHEWVSVQDMELATETIIRLAGVWEENA